MTQFVLCLFCTVNRLTKKKFLELSIVMSTLRLVSSSVTKYSRLTVSASLYSDILYVLPDVGRAVTCKTDNKAAGTKLNALPKEKIKIYTNVYFTI